MSDDLMNELSKLDKQWKETADNGSVQLPDGLMIFRIESAVVNRAQQGKGRVQVAMKLRVVAGEHSGKEVFQYQGLADAVGVGFFKRNMAKLELAPPESLPELPAWLPRLVGVTFQGQVKNKDGFLNIYPNKRVTLDPTSGTPAPSGGSLGM